MWIVAIAWMYVAVMMSVAEATAPNGTVLGACITFVFYGVLPAALVMYLISTPARRRARAAAQAAAIQRDAVSAQPDASGLPTGHPLPPERIEP
ncbi:MAG TPA: hypothetical protein VFM33_14110 [Aquabacterium sp.]|nr:hypothetical protein [Aquabacterium sp.]